MIIWVLAREMPTGVWPMPIAFFTTRDEAEATRERRYPDAFLYRCTSQPGYGASWPDRVRML